MIFSLTSFPMSGLIAERASPVNTGSYRKAWSGRSRNGQTISIPFPPRTLTLWRPVRNSLGRDSVRVLGGNGIEMDPYALAPGSKFTWTRLRAVGGRTNLWGRGCDRFGPLDFKAKSMQDGWGEDWPLTYEELAPYYDKTEALIGVAGGSEDVYNTPTGKHLLPPFNARCGEMLIKKGATKLGIKALAKPLAVLSKPYDRSEERRV